MSDQAKTCGTCRHWIDNRSWCDPYGTCLGIPVYGADDSSEVAHGLAEVWAAGAGRFYTKPEFGCTLHEPKEPAL